MKSAAKKAPAKKAKGLLGRRAGGDAGRQEVERKKGKNVDREPDLLAKVKELKGLDRELAEKLHAIVKAAGPDLKPKTWYGMPAYADANGKIVVLLHACG